MSKQIPEVNAPSRNEQLASLRKQLLGNQYFAACRGKLGNSIAEQMNQIIGKTPNPTQFKKNWGEFTDKAMIMGNLLAQYRRDGWKYAHEVLNSALISSAYIMPGETVPVEETVAITFVMPDPERTLLMIDWLIHDHWMDLDAWLNMKDGTSKSTVEPDERVNKLFEMFSTLEKHSRERRRRHDYEGWDLLAAHEETVLKQFPQLKSKPFVRCELGYGQWNDHIERVRDQGFLFAFIGTQAQTLKCFNRKQQKLLATWQLNLPKACVGSFMDFGLHNEAEHEMWRADNPVFVSHGVSAQRGLISLQNPVATRPDGKVITYLEKAKDYPDGKECPASEYRIRFACKNLKLE